MKLKLDQIRIKESMKSTPPHADKVKKAKFYIKRYRALDNPIILSRKFQLIDGYARFIALQEEGIQELDFITIMDNVTNEIRFISKAALNG